MVLIIVGATAVLAGLAVPFDGILRFWVLVGVGFYLPGRLVSPRGLQGAEAVATALVLGTTLAAGLWMFVLWSGVGTGWVWALLVGAAVGGGFRARLPFPLEERKAVAFAFAVAAGSVAWTQFGNGTMDPAGTLDFHGTYVPEALFHCAVGQEVRHTFPPEFPAGEPFSYHVLFNVLLALVVEATGVSMLDAYYRLLPILIVLLVVLAAFSFVRRSGGSAAAAATGALFLFLADDLSWLVVTTGLAHPVGTTNIWGTALGAPVLYGLHHNRGFLLGMAGLLVALTLGARALEERDRGSFCAAAVLTACLAEAKVFFPFLVLAGLGFYGVTLVARRRGLEAVRAVALFAVTTVALVPVLMLVLYGGGAGASPRDFFLPGYVGMMLLLRLDVFSDWTALRSALLEDPVSNGLLRVLPAMVLFTAGTIGARALGVIPLVRRGGRHGTVILASGAVVAGWLVTLVFVTPPVRMNVVYFWGASLCLLSVLGGLELWRRVERRDRYRWLILLAVMALALPGTARTHWIERSSFAGPAVVVSGSTTRAADVLRRAGEPGDVLLESRISWSALPALVPVRPVATWAHWWGNVLGREERVRRLGDVRTFFASGDPDRMREILRRYDVDWVWTVEGEDVPGIDELPELEPVFSEAGARLYRVER